MQVFDVEELIENRIVKYETYCKYKELCAQINGLIIKERPTYSEVLQIFELCRAGMETEAILCVSKN